VTPCRHIAYCGELAERRFRSWFGRPEVTAGAAFLRPCGLTHPVENDRGGKQKMEIRVKPVTTPTDLATRYAQSSQSDHCSGCSSSLISNGSVHRPLLWGRLSRQLASTAFWQYAHLHDMTTSSTMLAHITGLLDRESAGQ
jgi:hypothetical protein